MEDAVRSYRRRATVAVLGAITAAALSSCGLQPDTAATVGSTTITEKQVDEVVDSIPEQAQSQIRREQVVQDMVISTACKQYAAAKDIKYDTAPVAEQLTQQGLPAGPYQQVLALRSACFAAVAGTPGTDPTDDELKKVYEDVNKINPTLFGSFDQAKPALLKEPAIVGAFAAKHVAADTDVSVNPRYRTMNVPLVNLGTDVIMQVQLGESANTAVTDAPQEPQPTSVASEPVS
jgi:hypothetical protein